MNFTENEKRILDLLRTAERANVELAIILAKSAGIDTTDLAVKAGWLNGCYIITALDILDMTLPTYISIKDITRWEMFLDMPKNSKLKFMDFFGGDKRYNFHIGRLAERSNLLEVTTEYCQLDPMQFSNFHHLEKLVIKKCNIQKVSELGIDKLSNLKVLHLCESSRIDIAGLENLSSLKVLGMYYHGIMNDIPKFQELRRAMPNLLIKINDINWYPDNKWNGVMDGSINQTLQQIAAEDEMIANHEKTKKI